MADAVRVEHDPEHNRFVAAIDGHAGVLEYQRRSDALLLVHTEVPEALRGHGIAGQLAKAALDYARAEGLRVVAICPFVRDYLVKHPEYGDLTTNNQPPTTN